MFDPHSLLKTPVRGGLLLKTAVVVLRVTHPKQIPGPWTWETHNFPNLGILVDVGRGANIQILAVKWGCPAKPQ